MSHTALESKTTTSTVFSSQEKTQKKQGTLVRQFARKQYWLVEMYTDETITIQALNINQLPTGKKRAITQEELLENYTPEPQVYTKTVFPQMDGVEKTLDRADSCREKGETYSAEFDYNTVLELDEDNIRANFGAGLNFLNQGEIGKADSVFRRLVQLEGSFEKRHKHLFNDFGIRMRENKMYKQSIAFYSRALELTKDDENLHINIARPLYQQGLLAACLEHLFEALRIAPKNTTALKFLDWMEKKQCIPKNFELRVQQMLEQHSVHNAIMPLCLCKQDKEMSDFALPEALSETFSIDEAPEEERKETTTIYQYAPMKGLGLALSEQSEQSEEQNKSLPATVLGKG